MNRKKRFIPAMGTTVFAVLLFFMMLACEFQGIDDRSSSVTPGTEPGTEKSGYTVCLEWNVPSSYRIDSPNGYARYWGDPRSCVYIVCGKIKNQVGFGPWYGTGPKYDCVYPNNDCWKLFVEVRYSHCYNSFTGRESIDTKDGFVAVTYTSP